MAAARELQIDAPVEETLSVHPVADSAPPQ